MAGAVMMMPGVLQAAVVKKMARIGFIGVRLRGRNHLNNLMLRDDVVVPAICDIDPEALASAKKMMDGKNFPEARSYSGSDEAYLEMLEKEELDGVIISTPWLWHTRMSVAAMKAGVYAGVEVSAANTIEECFAAGALRRGDRCAGDDPRKCMLPPGCNGRLTDGAERSIW